MADFLRSITCPACGAANRRAAYHCLACGGILPQASHSLNMAARADDEDEEEQPRPRRQEGVQKGAPKPAAKKPAPRPARDEEDYDDERPAPRVKKPARRDEEDDDEEPESIRDNVGLNMVAPVGVSIWALSAGYLGVLSVLLAFAGIALGVGLGKFIGIGLASVGILFGILGILLGVMSFILRPKKTTYGSVTGYMRGILGIIAGFIGILGAGGVILFLATARL